MTDDPIHNLIGLLPDKYLEKTKESIHQMISQQMLLNSAKNGLYSLIFIHECIHQGKDSYAIVEDLKQFFFEMTKIDPEIAKQAEKIVEEHEKYLKELIEKRSQANNLA